MSVYHTREAFDARMHERRTRPVPLAAPPAVFWHVGCLNEWRSIVTEQLRLLHFAGLDTVTACVLGTNAEVGSIISEGRQYGVKVIVPFCSTDLLLWERPSIRQVWLYAQARPEHCVLYFHSKGVTKPNDRHKRAWRRLMQKEVIAEWRRNIKILEQADMCGVSWQELRDFPHFMGNFWMARCDWIKHLQDPEGYRQRFPHLYWAGQSWKERMHVETWIGSEQWHHIESFCCRNGCFWEGEQVFRYSSEIPGFCY